MAQTQFEATDSKLFIVIQEGLPLVETPFAEIGKRVGMGEQAVMERLQAFTQAQLLRSIAAVFYPRQVGYLERLVAFHVPSRYETLIGSTLSNHPGITECHEGSHDYNVWFTILVPPGSDPEQHIERLAVNTKASASRSFPILKAFKQRGVLPLQGWESVGQGEVPSISAAAGEDIESGFEPPSPSTIRLFQQLQLGLPLSSKPFESAAAVLGMTSSELLSKIGEMVRTSRMAGIAATVEPARVGLALGVWVLWVVPDARVEEVGQSLSKEPMVLHCSKRPAYPAWPYNLYTWLRVSSVAELENALERFVSTTGVKEYVAVKGMREYVSTTKMYYVPEDWQWEKAHLGPRVL